MLRRNLSFASQVAAAFSMVLATSFVQQAMGQAPTISKANNANNLNLGTSWVGGVAPSATDIAVWEATVAGANSTSLGADLSWLGLRVANPGGAVTIGGANTVTLGASGIDMTAATQNLTLNANVDLGAAQSWNVGAGRTLTVGGLINDPVAAGNALSKLGAGTLSLSRSNTYNGPTNLMGGATNLNFSGATPLDILPGFTALTIANANLNAVGAAGTSTTQSVTTTVLGAGLSTIRAADGAGSIMTLNLGAVSSQVGAVVRFEGPSTGDAAGLPVAATGTIVGAFVGEPNGIIGFYNGIENTTAGHASAGYGTVGLYDFAGQLAGTVAGGSQIPAFYTPLAAGLPNGFGTPANYDLTVNITNSNAGSQKNAGTVRFNTPGATTITGGANNLFTATAILVTPNMAAENTQLAGAGSYQVIRQTNPNGAQQGTIWQNNTQAFFSVTIPIIDGREGAGDATNMVKAGQGTVVFSGANTYTGGTHVTEGALMASATGHLGAAAAPVFLGGGTLVGNGNFATGPTRPITLRNNGGGLAATAGNVLTVDGVIADSANGGGRLTIGIPASAANGNVANRVAGTGAGTANTTDLLATGQVILAGANTYTGGTTVVGGTLLAANATGSATGTGAVTVAAGAGVGGSGSIAGAASVSSGGHVAPGVAGVNSGVGTLSLGGLALVGGSILDFDMSGAQNDMIASSGGLSLGGVAQVNLFQAGTTGGFMLNGTYNMFSITGGAIPSAATLNANLAIANAVAGGTYLWGVSGTNVTLTIGGLSSAASWNVNGSGNWGTAASWSPASAPNAAGASATFGNVLTTGTANIALGAVRTVGNLAFNNTNGGSYAINAGGGSLALNNGASVAVVSVVAGSHSINAPVTLASNTSVTVTAPSSELTVSGNISGARNMTFAGAGRTVLTGTNSYVDSAIQAGATLQVGAGGSAGTLGSGNLTVDGTLEVNRTGAVSLNAINGSGTVINSGAGTTTLSAANTGSFSTTVNAGAVVVGSGSNLGSGALTANGGAVDLNGTSPTVSALSGTSGTVNNSSATFSALTVNQAGASTFNGALTDTGTGNLQLIKTGPGQLTYGGTTDNAGGTSSYNEGAILVDSNIRVDAGQIQLVGNGALPAGKVLESRVSGAGVLLANTDVAGTILLHPAANTASGLVDVAAGNVATVSGSITTPPTMTSPTQIRINAGNDADTSMRLTGNMNINNVQVGIFIFERGNFTFAGNSTTTIGPDIWFGRSAGSNPTFLIRDNAQVTGNSNLILAAGGAATATVNLTLQNNAVLTSTAGNLELNAAAATSTTVNLNGGTLNLNTITQTATTPAAVNFNGTQVNVGASGSLISSLLTAATFNVQSGGAKLNTNGNDVLIELPLVHDAALTVRDGGLTKSGAGLLTMLGANTYNGPTRVVGGTLGMTNATLDDLADVFVSSGAKLEMGFFGPDVIDSLYLNGVAQAAGSYGASGSGATFINDVFFSGPGILQVTRLGAAPIAADFDFNGIVNSDDLVVWRSAYNVNAAADADGDGDSDGNDFLIWQRQLGQGVPPALPVGAAVPEPASGALAAAALVALAAVRRRQPA